MRKSTGVEIIEGSGNIFIDLGFSPTEARNLHIRSEMVTALRNFILTEGLTKAAAAKRLGASQARISDLLRGKLSQFSLDALVNMLTDAGLEVDIRIKPAKRAA